MRRLVVSGLVFGLACAACVPDPKKKDPEPATSGTPKLKLSDQPWRDGGPGEGVASPVQTDGREATAGYRAGVGAHAACQDKTCLGNKCGQACTQWMSENYKSFHSTNQRNVIYFNCFGACLAPPDAGKP